MRDLLNLIRWMLLGLVRSRRSLEAENLALRHQVNVLHRRAPKRPALRDFDLSFSSACIGLHRAFWIHLRSLSRRPFSAGTELAFAPSGAGNRVGVRQAEHNAGNSAADPPDEPRQSALGRSPHPWRAPQARHRYR